MVRKYDFVVTSSGIGPTHDGGLLGVGVVFTRR